MTMTLEKLHEEVDKSLETHVEIEIQKDVLLGIIRRLDRARERSGVIPIKQGIYIHFDEEKITARAMNSDYSTEIIIPKTDKNYNFLQGNSGGAVFMDTKLASMVNSLPRKKVKLTIDGSKATVSAYRSAFELQVLDHLEFPKFMDKKEGTKITIHADALKRMYEKTVFATSTVETRPVLTGVNHRLEDNTLYLVATDAHRLAQIHHELEVDEELESKNVTVPATAIQEVQKLLDGTVENMELIFTETSMIYIMDNGVTLFSRLINSAYPDTTRLIPDSYTTEIQFKAEDLLELVKRAMIVDQNTPVKWLIKAEDRQARMISREAEQAGFTEDIAPIKGEGKDIKLGLNIRYLHDALSHQNPSSIVKFQFISNMKPFLIRVDGQSDLDLDLILPVRIVDSDMDGDEVVIEDFRGDIQVEMLEEEAKQIE